MNIAKLEIPGVFLITPALRQDSRGYLEKVFDARAYAEHGMCTNIAEQFHTVSHKDVIRGMHFQTPPHGCAKYVSVSEGAITDVILDLRIGSPTFGKHICVTISKANRAVIYIPIGCAHGFRVLEESTCTRYLQTSGYEPLCDAGIRFDSFGADWGIAQPTVSERDRTLADFRSFSSPFQFGGE